MEEENVIEKDMTPRLIGETYLRKPTETSRQRCKYGVYRCQYCGQEFECATKSIKSGHTKSCGCQKGGITHGLSHNQFYETWKNMMGRCYNLKNKHMNLPDWTLLKNEIGANFNNFCIKNKSSGVKMSVGSSFITFTIGLLLLKSWHCKLMIPPQEYNLLTT